MSNPVVKTIMWALKSLLIGVSIFVSGALAVVGVLYLLILIPENIGSIISISSLTLILIFSFGVILYALVFEIKNKYKEFKKEGSRYE